MPEVATEKDLAGREVKKGWIPTTGTRLVILGNTWRVTYVKQNPPRVTLELVEAWGGHE